MELFDVYPLYDVSPVSAQGCEVFDDKGNTFLDLYGGHGVISIGHSHRSYVRAISDQIGKIGFYSNSIRNPLQEALAGKLGKLSQCQNYNLFLCNSGAEANENALKMASFQTGKKKIIAFENSFHGRTSAAVAVTDNEKIQAPLNSQHEAVFLPLNDVVTLEEELKKGDAAAVIIMLADQPLVTAAHIGQIIEKWGNDPDAIVATRYSGVDGPPVLFGHSYFAELCELEGDAGARQVLQAHQYAVRTVEFAPAAIDIDTPDDLKALLSQR